MPALGGSVMITSGRHGLQKNRHYIFLSHRRQKSGVVDYFSAAFSFASVMASSITSTQ